jgi:hypothetical protein
VVLEGKQEGRKGGRYLRKEGKGILHEGRTEELKDGRTEGRKEERKMCIEEKKEGGATSKEGRKEGDA